MGYSNGSDDAQRALNRTTEKIGDIETDLSIERNNREGNLSTTTESNIDGTEFDTSLEYQALDLLYSSLRDPSNGESRLEGLRAFPDKPEEISDQSWRRHWLNEYERAGLISGEELTERGSKLRNDEFDWWVEKASGIGSVDEFYDLLTTTGKQPQGGKIQAWKLYGNGEDSHTEIHRQTGLNPSTARTFSDELQELRLIDQDYNFTESGEHLDQFLDDHITYLERQTVIFDRIPDRAVDSEIDELMRDAYQGN